MSSAPARTAVVKTAAGRIDTDADIVIDPVTAGRVWAVGRAG